MNEGADLSTVTDRVALPSELALPRCHGEVPCTVRAMWKPHRLVPLESTTEFYDSFPLPYGMGSYLGSAGWNKRLEASG